jgi:hypothetical protein
MKANFIWVLVAAAVIYVLYKKDKGEKIFSNFSGGGSPGPGPWPSKKLFTAGGDKWYYDAKISRYPMEATPERPDTCPPGPWRFGIINALGATFYYNPSVWTYPMVVMHHLWKDGVTDYDRWHGAI